MINGNSVIVTGSITTSVTIPRSVLASGIIAGPLAVSMEGSGVLKLQCTVQMVNSDSEKCSPSVKPMGGVSQILSLVLVPRDWQLPVHGVYADQLWHTAPLSPLPADEIDIPTNRFSIKFICTREMGLSKLVSTEEGGWKSVDGSGAWVRGWVWEEGWV